MEQEQKLIGSKVRTQLVFNSADSQLTVSHSEELQALEDLHLFRITKVVPELFEFVYANQVHISVPCRDLVPFPTKISINKWEQAPVEKDDFPKLSEYWLRTAPKMVATMKLREGETSISMSRVRISLALPIPLVYIQSLLDNNSSLRLLRLLFSTSNSNSTAGHPVSCHL